MTTPSPDGEIVMFDADGQITEDKAKAVRGEVTERLPDGTTRSTLFEVSPSGGRS